MNAFLTLFQSHFKAQNSGREKLFLGLLRWGAVKGLLFTDKNLFYSLEI